MNTNDLIKSYKFRNTLPYPHQVRALQKALDLNKSIALFMEPGTGKTRVAIDFIGIKHQSAGIRKVLVIAPNVALGVWQDQIDEYLPRVIDRQVVLLNKDLGTVKERIEELKTLKKVDRLTFVLVNYDVIADQTRFTSMGIPELKKGMKDFLKRWKPEMVILDESHYIKKSTSSRSRAIHSLASVPKWKMCLSGTPITNSPLDLFSQYKFLNSGIFGTRWTDFKNRYARYGGFGGFKLLGYRNTDRLSQRAHLIAFEATKKEMDLPGKLPPQIIKIPMSVKTRKLYDDMETKFIAEVEELGKKATAAIILTKMIRLRQITGGFVRVVEDDGSKEDVGIGTEKLDALGELLNSHCKEGGYKVVVFAVFKWEGAHIKALCDKMGIKATLDVGNKADRVRFRDDKKELVYIVPISTGGIAVNELVAAHIGIFYSIDHSSDHIIQAMDRLDRPGQTVPVTYQFLTLKGTIDTVMYNAFVENKSIADEVVYHIRRRSK